MRKKIVLGLVLILICTMHMSGSVLAGTAERGIQVVSTVFPGYDFARRIAGDRARVSMLLPPGSESHSYEPTPQDIIKIQSCDVFIYVGGEGDEWAKRVLSSMDTSQMRIVAMLECVDAVEEEHVEGMESDEHADEEEHEHAYDEHVWTAPKNVKQIVARLAAVLAEADPDNAAAYQQNATDYQGELDALDAALQAVADKAVRKTLVFGDRFPFRYLADAYGLDYFAAFPGCSTESEPSAKTVAFLIDKVRDEEIPVVFHIEMSNMKMADAICEATGAKKLLLHACHNISKRDFEEGMTYLTLMHRNVEALKEALW